MPLYRLILYFHRASAQTNLFMLYQSGQPYYLWTIQTSKTTNNMATKTTFDFNNENITSGFQKVFTTIQDSKISVSSKSGKQWINIPLIFALVIAIIFPFIAILAVALVLLSIIKITVEREIKETKDPNKMIEIK